MPAATAPPGEAIPFLWLAGFAVCFALHMLLHPQARVFRDALHWLGHHPAPLLWLMASLMASVAWSLRSGPGLPEAPLPLVPSPWPEAFFHGLLAAWQRLALLFHQAVAPPPLWPGTLHGAAMRALISAAAQMWLCSYLVTSRAGTVQDATGVKRALARWRTILGLALCHLPWWWTQGRQELALLRHGLLPEFLLFLGPLPLVAAAKGVDFIRAGAISLQWWRRAWPSLLLFALTTLPLLALLEFCLAQLPALFPASRLLLRVLLESTLASAVHAWLFVSAALLLLRSGYVPPSSPDA